MMKKAFSLTEVMLAFAIVGVISALAIPILYSSYSERVLETKLKKVTTQIMTATETIMSDERAQDAESLEVEVIPGEGVNSGFYFTSAGAKTSNSTQGVQYFLENYFKTTKTNCGSGGSKKCVGTNYKSGNNKDLGAIPNDYYCISTPSAAAVCMARVGDYIRVVVDVNGAEKPNMTGVDTFSMYISNDGDLKDLDPDSSNCNKDRTPATVPNYAAGCFAKVVENGWKMPKS